MVPVLVMSEQRFGKAPDTPTTVELGVDATMATLRGVGALKGIPEDRLEKLESAFLKAMECEAYQNYLANNGLDAASIADGETYGKQVEESCGGVPRARERDAEPVSELIGPRDEQAESADSTARRPELSQLRPPRPGAGRASATWSWCSAFA